MAIGLGRLRSARGGGRKSETSRPTIREVCLLGLDLGAPDEGWTTGQEVTWQGRGYRIMATTTAAPRNPLTGRAPIRPGTTCISLPATEIERESGNGGRDGPTRQPEIRGIGIGKSRTDEDDAGPDTDRAAEPSASVARP